MKRSGTQRRAKQCRGRCAFTLIELLVVIGIISLLVAMTVVVGSKVIAGQKKALTETIMRNTMTAIEQFATEDPLRSIYGRKAWPTFGEYPPYQLAGPDDTDVPPFDSVREALEPAHPYFTDFSDTSPRSLRARVAYDLSGGQLTGGYDEWVSPNLGGDVGVPDPDDDIRALYTYLAVYSPGALGQVPEKHFKALKDEPEYVNPTGRGTDAMPGEANSKWIDVFGIHDAWDVPLDYMLYVKLEWGPFGSGEDGVWRVVERKPVLRSRGVEAEVARREAGDDNIFGTVDDYSGDTAANWIWSEPLPTPRANGRNASFWENGQFSDNKTSENGWARAVAEPDLHAADNERAFGFVPYP